VVKQRRLPDPGFASNHQDTAVALARIINQPTDSVDLSLPPEQSPWPVFSHVQDERTARPRLVLNIRFGRNQTTPVTGDAPAPSA
jgi:hypothetical protein